MYRLLVTRSALAARSRFLLLTLLATLCLAGPPSAAHAAITTTGNVDPIDTTTWTNVTDVYIGVSDADGTLVVNASNAPNSYHDLNSNHAYIGCDIGVTGQVTVDGEGSTWTSDYLYVGSRGNGMLDVTGGGTVSSKYGLIGLHSGSVGVVTVHDAGSTWTNSLLLWVGNDRCTGTLAIGGGGTVNSCGAWIGGRNDNHETSVATVDGIGSMWTDTNFISIGSPDGLGMLYVTGGATVAAPNVLVDIGALAIDIGNDSNLRIGGGRGTFTNDFVVAILAGANAEAGKAYSPILATTWNGTGTYQAIGGTWNPNHTFTASAVQTGAAAETITLNGKQPALIIDSGTGKTGSSVCASFAADSTPLTLTASVISGDTRNSLQGLLGTDETILSGWKFDVGNGYTSGQPAYLSFGIGVGYSQADLQLWHYSGSSWTEFAANDLTWNETYASFTVTDLSGYAVTGVPKLIFLPGDADKNGTTDATDLNTVLSFYNQTGTDWSKGDFNGDGMTDATDLNTVLSYYNQTLGTTAGSLQSTVPEPSSIAMLAAIALTALLYRRRKQA